MLPILTHSPFVHIEYDVEVQVMLPDGLHAPEALPEELPEEEPLPEDTDGAAGGAAVAAVVVATGAAEVAAPEFEPAAPEPEPPAAEDAIGAADATGAEDATGLLPLPDGDEEELELPPGTEPPVRPVKLRQVKLGREVKSPLALAPEIVMGAQFMYVSAVTLESQTHANTALPSLS